MPPRPINPIDTVDTGHKPITIVIPKPVVSINTTPDDTGASTPIGNGNSESTAKTPKIIEAKIDPSHPLTQPPYPPQSRRFGEKGRVELLIYVLANGRVGEARIASSSGFQRLDEATIREALRAWRFIPQQADGTAVASWQTVAITFRLENK